MNMPLDALQYNGERSPFASIDGAVEKLYLTPVPVRRYDESPCHLVGNCSTIVAPNQVQTQIEPCGTPCRRENLTFVDVEHVGIDAHPGKSVPQRRRVAPVRSRPFAVEQSGGGEYKRTGADGQQSRAATMCLSQRLDNRLGHGHVNACHPGITIVPASAGSSRPPPADMWTPY